MLLHIEITEHQGRDVLAMLGDLDVASAPQLHSRLVQTINDSSADLILDLRKVDFIDSFGLGVLISAHKRTTLGGRKLQVLAVPDGPVAELLRLTELDRILDVRPDLETAGPVGPAE